MRYLIAAVVIALLAAPVHADTTANCAGAWRKMPSSQREKTNYAEHMKMCMAVGYKAPASEVDKKPAGATGQCRDGTYTMSKKREDACSGHNGVADWF
jgi:hypothetical protein